MNMDLGAQLMPLIVNLLIIIALIVLILKATAKHLDNRMNRSNHLMRKHIEGLEQQISELNKKVDQIKKANSD